MLLLNFLPGNFAVVRLCKNINTNEEFALKIIDKSKCKGKVIILNLVVCISYKCCCCYFQEDMVENEVKILRKLDHPNVMKLFAEQDTKNMLFLVVEYVKGFYSLSQKKIFISFFRW